MADTAWAANSGANSTWAPNSEQVNMIVQLTNVDSAAARETYVKALNQNNGDAERVINEFFNASSYDAFASKYTYDTNAWSADRDGALPGLVVQGPDEHSPNSWDNINSRNFSAPSRPPSRNKSPLGNVADWQIETALGVDAPSNIATEDEEVQRAIALSLGETTTPQEPQQSGIVQTFETVQQPSPVFGPATRNDHNVDEWAMIRASPAPMDSLPSARKREASKSVFLRCRGSSAEQMHRLGPFIMIMHSIPTARNFFLLLPDEENSGSSYGNNNGWWRGEQIVSASSQDVRMVDEVKRLMAFLDNSERSYGTADILNSRFARFNDSEPIVRLFESLYNNVPDMDLDCLWTCIKTDNAGTVLPQHVGIMNFEVTENTPEPMRTLYGLWDRLFWTCPALNSVAGNEGQPPSFAYIEKPAKVIAMRIQSKDGITVEIPEALFIDRYLEKNVTAARKMRDQMSLMWRALGVFKQKTEKLSRVTIKSGQTADTRTVLKRMITHNDGFIRQARTRALWRKHEEQTAANQRPLSFLSPDLYHLVDEVELTPSEQEEVQRLESEGQKAHAKLAEFERACSRINAQRDMCVANLNRLNQTFTVPSDDESENPTHKYTLRGVITSMNVVYMSRRREPKEFEEVDNDADLNEWYMVSWDGDENQVKHESIKFDKVRENMFTEVDAFGKLEPVLVYAAEKNLSEDLVQLSSALEIFVKQDNRLFKQELIEQPEQRDKKRVGFRSPQSPAKRQRSDSGDSMDSNRASLGDMSDGDRAQMMADQMIDNFGGSNDSGIDTEMMDMQPISAAQMANEIAAHMPPTPSLSADGSVSPPIRRSTEQLARMSLEASDGDSKAPEMAELQTPFLVRRPASAQAGLVDHSAPESAMDWPDIDETTAISGGSNPEEFYHPPA